jgi:hypothetical protein
MKKIYILSVLLLIFVNACKKEEITNTAPINTSVNGLVQKGPFVNGTAVDLFELNTNLGSTGKVFSSQIVDNSGSFQFASVSLNNSIVSLRANGFYYNEVTGTTSTSPITLFALADISNQSTLNVNVLSHLEKARVEFLISQGISFIQAKRQAMREVLSIFFLSKNNIATFENLNITQSGDDHAILLAVSTILQGYRTEAELTELLANISSDIRNDGVLNDASLGSALANDASNLNLAEIRNNLNNRYASLGMSVTIPNFEKFVTQFVDSNSYSITKFITYPPQTSFGTNVLFLNKNSATSAETLSFAAEVPKGMSLKIKMFGRGFGYSPFSVTNWNVSPYDNQLGAQVYDVIESGKLADLRFSIFGDDTVRVEYYENNAVIPTRVRELIIAR